MPAFRWTRPWRKPKEQLADFVQGEPGLPGTLHHRQTEESAVVVAALAIPAHRRRKNPDLLVVANGGGAQTKHARDIGNCQVVRHSKI